MDPDAMPAVPRPHTLSLTLSLTLRLTSNPMCCDSTMHRNNP